jgi:hypothetical protein
MARSDNVLVAQETLGAYPSTPLAANSADLVETAGDAVFGHQTPLVNRKTLVIAHNTSAATARTVTFLSVADAKNRTGDITAYSLAAGEIAVFGPFATEGWANAGNLWIDVSHAEMKLAVITLP